MRRAQPAKPITNNLPRYTAPVNCHLHERMATLASSNDSIFDEKSCGTHVSDHQKVVSATSKRFAASAGDSESHHGKVRQHFFIQR